MTPSPASFRLLDPPSLAAPRARSLAWDADAAGRAGPGQPSLPATLALACFLALTLALASPTPTAAGVSAAPPRRSGATGMPGPHSGSLLVSYYEAFLRDQDVQAFRREVVARYMEGTLGRLAEAPDVQTRRAAVFALGLVGSFEANPIVARALRDTDPTVRSLAENGLWAIWFRADSAANNATLAQVSLLIGQHEHRRAVIEATRLIERAPRFAEAYNQRAIAAYHLGQFESGADDCRRTLELNPYHIGALAGLAKCLLRLDRRDEALDALRKAYRLQPYSGDIKALIATLETGEP